MNVNEPHNSAASCVACGNTLKPVLEGYTTNYQFESALWIGFFGGYGMFCDNIGNGERETVLPGQPDYEAVICHGCAHDLCIRVPWIEKLFGEIFGFTVK